MPPAALISSVASIAPLRMNSPYPPSGPERIVWQPILIGFFSFKSVAALPGSASAPAARAVEWRKRRRVSPRRGAMRALLRTAIRAGMIRPAPLKCQRGREEKVDSADLAQRHLDAKQL